MYRKDLITFCGSKVNVEFDVNGEDGKMCFLNVDNGVYGRGDTIKTRHPNILKGVLVSKRGWGLWLDQWTGGINEWCFTKEEILNEFKIRNIEIPEPHLKEFENLTEKKRKKRNEI